MALVAIPGIGMWLPTMPSYLLGSGSRNTVDITLDADEEELQILTSVTVDRGGSKTFGTSGAEIGWLMGAATTFAAGSTLRVGLKHASKFVLTGSTAGHATIGAAAFDVWKDLVGGTDTLTSTSWQQHAMTGGTPFPLADGDLVALCFHLNVTSGSPSVKIRLVAPVSSSTFPAVILATAGPVYTAQVAAANCLLRCDDGTYAWSEPSSLFSVGDGVTPTIGNGTIYANIFQVPFPCRIDALQVAARPSTFAADFAMALYSTPLTTPTVMEELLHDANLLSLTGGTRPVIRRFTTPPLLLPQTDYALGVRQTTATAMALEQYDVSQPDHLKPNGLDATCYAAISTAGGAFVKQNNAVGVAGARRYLIWARVSHLDNGVPASPHRSYAYSRARGRARAVYAS